MSDKPKANPEQSSTSHEVNQYVPGDKLKKGIEQHIFDNTGIKGELWVK